MSAESLQRERAGRLARLAAGAIADGDVVEARALLVAAGHALAVLEPSADADPEYWPAAGKDGER